MNEIIKIKALLERYYEGESTDSDEQCLYEYFNSNNIADELKPYRSIFVYLQYEKEHQSDQYNLESAAIIEPAVPFRPNKWQLMAIAAAACLLAFIFLPREKQSSSKYLCSGTYVMVDGVCYDDLSIVSKYAAEAIDQVTRPIGENSATAALDFLDEE